MITTYSLTRTFDDDDSPYASASFTTNNVDHINCAYMIAAGFNTMSRNFMGDFVLAVVDTKAGTVQYDGKIEKIERTDPHTMSTSFKFEASTDADTMVTIFDNENGRLMFPGKLKFSETASDEEILTEASTVLVKGAAAKLSRSVLIDAYAELQAVKEVLADAGVETIPADAGVKDLIAVKRVMSQQITRRDTEISELVQALANRTAEVEELRKRDEHERHARQNMEAQHARSNEAARAELCKYVYGAHLKKKRLTVDDVRHDLEDHFRGMLDVLAKFLVVTGEADADEGHAVARRLSGIDDE